MKRFAISLFALFIIPATSIAESTISVEVKAGENFTVDVSKADYDAGLRTIQLIAKSSSNRSGSFSATISAPPKTKIKTTYTGTAPSRTAAQAIAAGRFPDILKVTTGGRMVESVTIGGTNGSSKSNNDASTCGGLLPAETVTYYIELYKSYGIDITAEMVCDAYYPGWNGGSGGGSSSGNSTSMKGAFPKDACSKLTYFLKVEISLGNVDPAVFTDGIQISGAITIDLDEALIASYKPRSDGKYAPNPIIIGEIKRYYVEDTINIATWKGGKPRTSSNKKFGETLFWNGGYFGVIPTRPTGRAMSVSVTDGKEFIRNGCLKMIAGQRHNINGYH